MQCIGFRKSDFTTKDGTEIKGYNVYFIEPIVNDNGQGMAAERIYLSESKISKMGINLEDLLNEKVALSYNRWGKVENITPLD